MDHQSIIIPRDLEGLLCDETAEPKALPLSLLKEITNGFSDEQIIGSGGYAVVYKGNLENWIVAVKRISNTYKYKKEFQREVECLMIVRHKNVVRFLGYCADTQGNPDKDKGKFVLANVQERLLCFEYLPNGSLHEYITDIFRKLQWRERYQIITGISEGLHYLHQKNIVHLDLKPENILLGHNWVPKITDFGISRCFDEIQRHAITQRVGTLGYMAPEYFNCSEVKDLDPYKLDIYSLRVVIIELLTGNKACQDVEKVVERWTDMLEESQREVQQKQIRLCAEIGKECTNIDPMKRPDTEYILSRLGKPGSMYGYIKTGVTISQQIISDKLSGSMRALWLRYQQLNPDLRRCMEYCSIFPKYSKLRMVDLVRLWIAQGFVRPNRAEEDIEDAAESYIQELVSCSFLEPTVLDCFRVNDEMHDILDKVAGHCFRIENARGESWEGNVPRNIQHLLIQHYDEDLITEKIYGLENLITLIIYAIQDGKPVKEKVIKHICKMLPKLRVLAIAFAEGGCPTKQTNKFWVPESISQLNHLRYFSFKANPSCTLLLPRELSELHNVQVLDFGDAHILHFNGKGLVNLRHIICNKDMVCPSYIGRLVSIQTIPKFRVSDEEGRKLNQLRGLNNLVGSLQIISLENVKSKEAALEANLAAKGRLTELTLEWKGYCDASQEFQAEVLEGLCPPAGLQKLKISCYNGLRYPDWMEGKHNGGPKDLQELDLSIPLFIGGVPQIVEAFPHLLTLRLSYGHWDALPRNMEHLTSLKSLSIHSNDHIQLLPTLPRSLEEFNVSYCDRKFMKSCVKVGHPNWYKIEHIPKKTFSDFPTLIRWVGTVVCKIMEAWEG